MFFEYETMKLYYLGIKVVSIPSVYSLDSKKNDFFIQEYFKIQMSVTKQTLRKTYPALLTHDIRRDIFLVAIGTPLSLLTTW